MKQFLLVYRRSTGDLLEFEDLGTEAARAFPRRSEAERQRKDDPDVEVILLGAASKEALLRTHSRYFKSIGELAADLVDALPKAS